MSGVKQQWSRGLPGERLVARLAHRFLTSRGWIVQLNTPDRCSRIVQEGDKRYDWGWTPMFSVRYGKTPVYRAPGDVRWLR